MQHCTSEQRSVLMACENFNARKSKKNVRASEHGTHSRGGKRNSLQEKKPVCVSPRDGPRRTGPPGSGQPTPTLCTNHFLCLGFIKHHIPSRRKSSILPRKCRLSPLFPSLRRNFSSFLIPFITIRVGVDPPPSFCCNILVSSVRLGAVGPKKGGLT